MRTNLLLGAAAVGVLITGAIAQTTSNIERIKDPAGQQNATREAEPKKNVRTVYPNTQNAEQAAQQSKAAQGAADASRQAPGDVAPVSNAQQPSQQKLSDQAAAPAAQPAPTSQQNAQTPGTQSPQPPSASPSTTQQPAPTATQRAPQPAAAEPARTSSSVIALDTRQQASIGQAIAQRGFKPLTNVSFSIAVGTKVPAAVQLRALPADLATFVPQYRGYSFVVVEEQIVIVDPGTHEIVAIVPYTAAAPATRAVETPQPRSPVAEKPMVNRPVNLNTEERTGDRRPVTEQRKKTPRSTVKREVREERAPRIVTIEEEPIRGPAFRSHRFIDDDDDVIVAPRQNGFFGFFR